MKIRKLLAALLASPLPILLLSNPSNAFNLIYKKPPTTDAFYNPGNGKIGYLYIDDLKKLEPPNPIENRKSQFWRVLTSSFPDWDFASSGYPVYGDIVVNEYRVCPPGSFCADPLGSVGSRLQIDYVPNFKYDPNQPDPDTGNVRWIQFVRSNHSLVNGHGFKESVIDLDTKRPGNGTPYYYAKESHLNKNNPYFFTDDPSRGDIDKPHDWTALLYLVEEITKPDSSRRKALIYGGISWGWHNRIIDKQPDTPPGKPRTREQRRQEQKKKPQTRPRYCPVSSYGCDDNDPPSNGGSGGGGFNKYDPNERYTTIPESTPVIGLITLAAWGIVKTLKLRKNK